MQDQDDIGTEGNKRGAKAVPRGEPMKAEYDFSKAERGKFYRADATFSLTVYLAPDVSEFINQVAEQKQIDVQDLVNDWLRKDMELIQSVR